MHRALRACADVFYFITALWASSYAISLRVPLPNYINTRFEEYVNRKDEVTVLFVGSSLTYRQVMPWIVDEQLAELGYRHTSYNLGVAGAQSHEINALITKIMREEPSALKVLVIEPCSWTSGVRNDSTRRFEWWHTLAETLSVIETAKIDVFYPDERTERIRRHLWACLTRFSNVGAMKSWYQSRPNILDIDGWVSFTARPGPASLQEKLLNNPGAYEWLIYRISEDPTFSLYRPTYNTGALLYQVDFLSRSGITVVYMTPPSTVVFPEIERLHRERSIPHLMNFSHPPDHPGLFEINNRHDGGHLNSEGATLYSREIGKELGDILAELESS